MVRDIISTKVITRVITDIYACRTEKNVMNSDATLIITATRPAGGTAYAIECATELGKPYFIANLGGKLPAKVVAAIERWLEKTKPAILNVAGPRESKVPGIYQKAYAVLQAVPGR
jgi:adenine/guanine phosphoribosyltransferase-like PRPP-binding protein